MKRACGNISGDLLSQMLEAIGDSDSPDVAPGMHIRMYIMYMLMTHLCIVYVCYIPICNLSHFENGCQLRNWMSIIISNSYLAGQPDLQLKSH